MFRWGAMFQSLFPSAVKETTTRPGYRSRKPTECTAYLRNRGASSRLNPGGGRRNASWPAWRLPWYTAQCLWPWNPETPQGAWGFHDQLIPHSPRKPFRIWMEVGDRDLFNPNTMRDGMHDWGVANERT